MHFLSIIITFSILIDKEPRKYEINIKNDKKKMWFINDN